MNGGDVSLGAFAELTGGVVEDVRQHDVEGGSARARETSSHSLLTNRHKMIVWVRVIVSVRNKLN